MSVVSLYGISITRWTPDSPDFYSAGDLQKKSAAGPITLRLCPAPTHINPSNTCYSYFSLSLLLFTAPIVTYNPINMALRISAKRVAATLKASNITPPSNGILKRNASQAAAAASSLPEEIRSAIHVGSPAPRLNIN
jgi:hypothetical protein